MFDQSKALNLVRAVILGLAALAAIKALWMLFAVIMVVFVFSLLFPKVLDRIMEKFGETTSLVTQG